MSLYGKMAGGLIALTLVGGSAAYVASAAGSVALFSDDGTEPIAQYSTPIADVNPADAALLKEGIRLRGLTEVSRLLEDLDIE